MTVTPTGLTPTAAITCRTTTQVVKHIVAFAFFALLFGKAALGQRAAPARSCESLAGLILPNTEITMAQAVAAAEFKIPVAARPAGPSGGAQMPAAGRSDTGPGGQGGPRGGSGPQAPDVKTLPAFCRVAATLKPTHDSYIRVEVWLPLSTWNGNLLGVGGGGWAGHIFYTGNPLGLIDAVKLGYAAVNTDAGHEGNDGSFIAGHPEKLIDYAYRANHEMTVTAKAVIAAFYATAPKHTIFIGCSLGSLQALQEARRYPEDYEGIVAGAPMTPVTVFNAVQIWPGWLIHQNPDRFIPTPKYMMIHEAAIKTCATPVGLHDGMIEHPEQCDFDPGMLLCKGPDTPNCLTAPQVDLMRQIYLGPLDHKGKPLFPGLARGGELQLPAYANKIQPFGNALNLYRDAVHQDPNWDWKTMTDFPAQIELATKVLGPDMNVDANLKPFFEHGGKLILYIGWTDYHNPLQTIEYYNAVVKFGGPKGAASIRLFNVPGMDHCSGGAGCDSFDKVVPIQTWVETGKAPDQITSSKVVKGNVIRTRPLCAFPKVAQYSGTGSMDEAANFTCATKAKP